MNAGSRGRGTSGVWRLLLGALLALVAVVAAGCGAGLGAGDPGSGKTITLYNAQHQETTDALIKAFTAQTGIHVLVKSDGEDVLTAQLEQEGSRSPADVFYAENSNWLQQLDDRGMLAKVDASTLAQVPARDSATNGDWVGVSKRFSVLIYNPSKVTCLTAADLGDAACQSPLPGDARAGSRRDRLLADRHLDPAGQGSGGRAQLAQRAKGECRIK